MIEIKEEDIEFSTDREHLEIKFNSINDGYAKRDQILENQKLRQLVEERIKEDLENCCCLNKRSCTWCHDRKIQQSFLDEAKK